MARAAALLVLAACGRLGFAPQASVDAQAGAPDASDASDASAARPELVQTMTANNSDATSLALTLAPTRSDGMIVIATLSYNIGATTETVASISDDALNTYVFAGARGFWNGDDGAVEIWYAASARPASTVQIASTGVTSRVAWGLELANMEPTAPLEGAGQFDDRPPPGGMPVAPVVGVSGRAVVVSLVMVNGTVTQVAAGSPFSLLSVINGDAAAYAIVDAPGSYGAILDAPGSGNYAAVTAAFRGLAPR